MIPRGDISATPVSRVSTAQALEGAADARQEAFARSLSALVGKSMQAQVVSRMGDGTFLVNVAGATARMALPANPQAGAEVPLTLVSLTPRPTFLVGQPDAQGKQGIFTTAFAVPTRADAGSQAGPQAATQAAAQTAALATTLTASQAAAQAALPAALAAGQPASTPALPPRAGADNAARGLNTGAANALAQAALAGKHGGATALAASAADPAPVLSNAARVLSTVLGAALKAEPAPAAIVARAPLLPAPVIEPGKLASALHDAIGDSGLFYESHVAEWSAGQRPLTALQREPQMQAARPPGTPGSPATADNAARSEAPALLPLRVDSGSGQGQITADPATAQFINLQLNTQEQGRVAWQGQLFPGQQLEWQISRDAPDSEHHGPEAPEPAWRSALRFHFPLLGEIGANVVMVGEQLHIQVKAGSPEIGKLLRERSALLAGALDAAGTPLASLTVSGPADDEGKP